MLFSTFGKMRHVLEGRVSIKHVRLTPRRRKRKKNARYCSHKKNKESKHFGVDIFSPSVRLLSYANLRITRPYS